MTTAPTTHTRRAPLPIRILAQLTLGALIVLGIPIALAAVVQSGIGAVLLVAAALFLLYRLHR